MRITVTARVDIDQVDDLAAFSLATDLPPSDLDARLREAGLGTAGDGHAWIDAEALRTAASDLATDPDWHTGFDRMLDYARSKGWLDAEGAIRAHITPLG